MILCFKTNFKKIIQTKKLGSTAARKMYTFRIYVKTCLLSAGKPWIEPITTTNKLIEQVNKLSFRCIEVFKYSEKEV